MGDFLLYFFFLAPDAYLKSTSDQRPCYYSNGRTLDRVISILAIQQGLNSKLRKLFNEIDLFHPIDQYL